MIINMYDAVIIGSGISGAAIANVLARYQLRVAVFEKASDICGGASRSNSATVHSGHDATYGSLKAHYNVLGNAMYDKLCADLSVPFSRNGMILFATSEADKNEIDRLKQNADQNGVPGVQVLDRASLLALEGSFGEEVIGGLYAPSSGQVCPYSLVIALCEHAAENGVSFFLNTAVLRLEKQREGYLVHTAHGSVQTRFVFNCAGVYADEINNMISGNRFHITPRKGEHLILDKKLAPYVKATISQTPFDLPSGGHTKGMGIMPSVDGTIILGCNSCDVADKEDTATSEEGISQIIRFFEENWRHLPIHSAVPSFPRHLIISAFAGLRPHPDTDDFIIGEAADAPGFYNMAGIESPGLTAAPAIAQELVNAFALQHHIPVKEAYRPMRTHKKAFRNMIAEEREQALASDPNYGHIVCRCEQVTRADVLQAIHSPVGARTVNAVKMRTRAGMGRCQGGFCCPEVVELLSKELDIPMSEVTMNGAGSEVIPYEIGSFETV
jgi:glycerol-3-phosphate dehydrogenase